MASQTSMFHFLLFLLAIRLSSSSQISTELLESHGSHGRNLKETTSIAECPVDFGKKNYTVLTSQCKGPNYTPKGCCRPLKQLICPVVDHFNNLNTNCAE